MDHVGHAEHDAPPPRLLSLVEAADVAGCSVRTLRRRIWSGELVATRIDRHVRVSVDDLRAFLNSRRDLRLTYGPRPR